LAVDLNSIISCCLFAAMVVVAQECDASKAAFIV